MCVTGYSQGWGVYCADWYAFRYEFLLYIPVWTMLIWKFLRAFSTRLLLRQWPGCPCALGYSPRSALYYALRGRGARAPCYMLIFHIFVCVNAALHYVGMCSAHGAGPRKKIAYYMCTQHCMKWTSISLQIQESFMIKWLQRWRFAVLECVGRMLCGCAAWLHTV